MKSKIIYNPSDYDLYEKKICDLIANQTSIYGNKRDYLAPGLFYNFLLYVKYLIEENNLDFMKIINGDLDSLLPYLEDVSNYFVKNFIEYRHYEVLKKMIFDDYYIKTYQDRILDAYLDSNKKYLLISTASVPYINKENIDVCLRVSSKSIHPFFERYQLLDRIIGINRKYCNEYKDIKIKDYDEIILINDRNFIDFGDLSRNKVKMNSDVFMICNYSDISRYKSNNRLFSDLELKSRVNSIYIDNDKAYVRYHKYEPDNKDKKINIKNLSDVKDDNLSSILNKDEEIEDISIYVSPDDIINNHYRIGFKSYNNKDILKYEDIIKVVDQNERIINKIRELDDIIVKEINKLIIK